MNVIWILGGLVLAGAFVAFGMTRRHEGGTTELGSVSGQWLAEHRHSQE